MTKHDGPAQPVQASDQSEAGAYGPPRDGARLAVADYRRLFLEHAAVMLVVDVETGVIVAANSAAQDFYGWPVSQLEGRALESLSATLGEADGGGRVFATMTTDERARFQCKQRGADGRARTVEIYGSEVLWHGRPVAYLIVHDISERIEVEGLLRKAEADRRERRESRLCDEHEKKLRTFFEAIGDMVVVVSLDGKILFSNLAVEQRLGFTAPEIGQMHVLDFHAPEDRAEAAEILGAMLRQERSSCPLPVQRKDGALVPVSTRVWPGQWGGQDCIYALIQELTAEQQERQLLERLFSGNPAPMALASLPDNRLVDVNVAFLTAFGYERGELLGRTPDELGLWAAPVRDARLAAQQEEGVTGRSTERRAFRKDGEPVDGLFWHEVIRSPGQEHYLTTMVDLTARKKAEEALAMERQHLAWILDGTRVGTWQWNVQTGEVTIDERWAEIIGHTKEELVPISIETWMDCCHPDDLRESNELLEEHFQGRRSYYEFEARMRHRNGEWVWVLDRGKVATRTPDGRPLMMFGTHQDITRRRRVEEDLRERVAFEELLVASHAALFKANEDELDALLEHVLRLFGEYVGVDRSYIFRFDNSGEQMSNTHEWCAAEVSPEKENLQDLPVSLFPAWMDTLRQRRIVHIPQVETLPDSWQAEREMLGAQGIQSLLVLPVYSGNREIGFIGFDAVRKCRHWGADERSLLSILSDSVGVALDRADKTRDLRRASERAHQLAQQAENANRTKSLFLANMSHEIRTPLNAILGFSQVLARDPVMGPQQRESLYAIIRGGEHLLQLINDVLDMSKIEAGRTTLTPSLFSPSRLFDDVRRSFAVRARQKGVEFRVGVHASVPARVEGDEGKLRQVLFNLTGNAFKFTHKGAVTVKVRARHVPGSEEHVMLEVEVADTGSGIALEDQGRLFQPFVQVGEGARSGGTGLGLAISRKFVELMGGRITAESILGQGTCFRFNSRLRVNRNVQDALCDTTRVKELEPSERPCRLLVVDDVEDNREMMRMLLQPVGFEVTLATGGREAIQLLETMQPHAIVMDMRMPDLDGWETTRRIKATKEGASVPIVAVTAGAFEEDEQRALEAGADAYLRKPFRREELFRLLGRELRLRYQYEMVPVIERTEPPEESSAVPGLAEESLPLSPDVTEHLLTALREGDFAGIMTILDSHQDAHPDVVEHLRKQVEEYAYDELEELLAGAVASSEDSPADTTSQ